MEVLMGQLDKNGGYLMIPKNGKQQLLSSYSATQRWCLICEFHGFRLQVWYVWYRGQTYNNLTTNDFASRRDSIFMSFVWKRATLKYPTLSVSWFYLLNGSSIPFHGTPPFLDKPTYSIILSVYCRFNIPSCAHKYEMVNHVALIIPQD